MNRVKLVALDLDGTLLASDHRTVPQENLEAIRAADAHGVRVTICTGRMLEDATDFIRRLNLPCMIIAANGSRASDGPLPEGTVFFRQNLAPRDARRAIDLLLGCGLIVNAFEDGRVTTENFGTGWTYHCAQCGLLQAIYGREALYDAAERGVMKLFAVPVKAGDAREAARLEGAKAEIRRALPHLQVTDSGSGLSGTGNVEVMPPDSGKGSALSAMAARLGLAREKVMAVGDADNDMSMLAYAYHSVAMGNATPAVKAACRYETVTNDECGVARILRRVLAEKGITA